MKFKGFILLGLWFAVLLVTSALATETSKGEKKANEVKDMNDAAKSIRVDTEQMGESDQAINQAAEKYMDIGGGWEGGSGGGGYGGEGGPGGGGYGGERGPGGGGYSGEGGPGGGGYGWRGGGRGGGGGHCRFGCCGGYGSYGCWRCC